MIIAERIEGLTIGMSLDSFGLDVDMAKIKRSFKGLNSSIKTNMNNLKFGEKSLENYQKNVKTLNTDIEKYRRNMETLSKRHKQAVEDHGANSKAAQELAAEYNKQANTLNYLEGQLESANAELKKMQEQQRIAESSWGKLGNTFEETGNKLKDVGRSMRDVGKNMAMYVTAPLVTGFGLATKASIDWESAFAGVKKTVDDSAEGYQELSDGILDMSKNLPVAATDIAAVAESAGQLGIERDSILDFTKTVIDLGESTNMTREQAATEFARFANIVSMPQSAFNNLGSSIVALGNSMATTESEIMSMTMRVAAQGNQVGMTEADIVALSGTMSSLGIEAEAGGTAMTTVLKKIDKAVGEGGKSLSGFAKASGVSSKEFKKAWESDPITALQMFIQGLEASGKEGKNLTTILGDLGIKGIREADTILRMAGNSKLLGDAVKTSTDAWNENSALTDEANQRYETMASKLQVFKNHLFDLALDIGNILAPYVIKVTDFFTKLIEKIRGMSDGMKIAGVIIGALVAAIGPLLIAGGLFLGLIGNIMTALAPLMTRIAKAGGLSNVLGNVIKTLAGRFSFLLGPVGIAIGTITTLASVFTLAYKKSETFREGVNKIIDSVKNAFAKVKEFIEGIKGLFHDDGQSGRDILASLGFSDKFIEAVDFIALKLSHIRGLVTNFIDGIKGLFKDDGQGGRDLLSSIGISDKMIAVLDGIALSLSVFRQNVIKYFGAAVDFVKNSWSGLMSWFSSSSGTMVDKTVGIFGSIKDAVSTGIQASVDFVKNIWGGLINWWNQNSDGILSKATSIFNSVKDTVSTAISVVVSYVKSVWWSLTVFWNQHGDMILQAAQNVWNGIKTVVLFVTGVVWTGIKKFASGIYTVIKFALDNILAGWAVVWPYIEKIALGTINILWNGAKTIFPYIVSIIRTSMSVISKIMSFVWPAVKFIIVETWSAIKGTIDGALKVITGLIQFFGALFTGNWTEMWNAVKKILSGAVQFIWNFVQVSFFGRIIKGGMLFIKSFAGLFTTMWGGIRSVFSTVISWIVGFVRNSFTRMSNTIGSITQTTRNIISTIWNSVLSFFRTIISGIVNFVRNRFVSMRDTINSITSVTRDLISKLWNNIFEFFRTVISGIVNFVRTRFTNMKNNVSNLFAGIRDLTQRIWNGVKNNIVNPVKNAVDTGLSRFRSFRDRVTEIFTKIKDNVSSRVTDMIDNVKAMPGKMKDGIVKGAGAVKEGMLTVARKMVDGLASGVNGVIGGIDWVLDKLKAPTLDYEFKPSKAFSWYAKGTDGHKGGHAILGDGTGDNSGSELTLLPNGKAFMSADKPTLYPNLPKGTQVISAKNTRKLFDSIPMYNGGKGLLNSTISKGKDIFNWGKDKVTSAVSKVKEWTGNVFDYIKKPGELLDIAINKLGVKIPSVGVMGDIVKGGFKFVKDKAVGFIKDKLTGFFDGGSVSPTGKGVSRWKNVILQAAAAMGEKITGAELNGILAQIQRESGGNEKIIQSSAVWDVNTAAGNPARGLLQYIPQTFAAYKVPGHGNIYSGYDQLLAFFNNKTWRRDLPYGRRGWGPRGGRKFATGGLVNEGLYHLGEEGWPEWIIPTAPNRRTEAMKLLALAGKEIQGNKRPNQLPNVSSGNGGSNDNGYMKQLLEATLEQNEFLKKSNELLTKLLDKKSDVYLGSRPVGEVMDAEQAKRTKLVRRVAY